MSQSKLVTTTVGISLMSNTRLPISCPAAWKLSKIIGTRDRQSMSGAEEMVGMVLSMAPDWNRIVEIITKRAWMKKEVARVPRRRGWSRRQRREKKNAPRVKQRTEVRDLAQP